MEKSHYPEYENKLVKDINGQPISGDVFNDGTILRFKNGYLDGGVQPAIEQNDGYAEYYNNGIFQGSIQL